ncbi:MAG: hypothetical protein ACI95K_001873, partial [Lentimonas sp.]
FETQIWRIKNGKGIELVSDERIINF